MYVDDNPYAPPSADALSKGRHSDMSAEAWRDGKLLVVRKGAELPDRCLKCDAPAEGYRFGRTLTWHKPFWYLLIFVSIFLYAIAYFFIRWQAKVTVGVCPRHRANRQRAILIGWLVALAGLGTIIVPVAFPARGDDLAPILVIVGIVLILAGIIGGIVGAQVLVPQRINEHFVWLSKVSPDYLSKLPDWNA
jgi:hypothetical protein